MSWGGLNPEREKNLLRIEELIAQGYVDIGWCNSGAKFSYQREPDKYMKPEHLETLQCGMYHHRGTNEVYIDHVNKEIKHVDMSD